MTSWQVRLATALAWLGVLPGLACLYLATLAFRANDMLLFVMPMVGSAAVVAGVVVTGGAAGLALRLQSRDAKARLQTCVAGTCLAFCGFMVLFLVPLAGLLLLLYGGTLAALMTSSAAARELGPWRQSLLQPAPWGATPGTGIWAPSPPTPGLHPTVQPGPVQGPWAPDPTTLPWFSWKNHSGPRAPWWQTWQEGLRQGIPLWELVLLVLSLAAFFVGLVGVFVCLGGSATLGTLHGRNGHWAPLLLLLPASWAVVAWLEMRMRERLAGRR